VSFRKVKFGKLFYFVGSGTSKYNGWRLTFWTFYGAEMGISTISTCEFVSDWLIG
jgi:hypothetical protein